VPGARSSTAPVCANRDFRIGTFGVALRFVQAKAACSSIATFCIANSASRRSRWTASPALRSGQS